MSSHSERKVLLVPGGHTHLNVHRFPLPLIRSSLAHDARGYGLSVSIAIGEVMGIGGNNGIGEINWAIVIEPPAEAPPTVAPHAATRAGKVATSKPRTDTQHAPSCAFRAANIAHSLIWAHGSKLLSAV